MNVYVADLSISLPSVSPPHGFQCSHTADREIRAGPSRVWSRRGIVRCCSFVYLRKDSRASQKGKVLKSMDGGSLHPGSRRCLK
jgi:hypothetical protein